MNDNICKFVPVREGEEMRVINFVFESNPAMIAVHHVQSWGTLYLTARGEGTLHTDVGDFPLRPGTVFFTAPRQPFYIEQDGGLAYYYISFMSQRFLTEATRVRLTRETPIREGFASLEAFWKQSLDECTQDSVSLAAESVLLYTLSRLGRKQESVPDPAKTPRHRVAAEMRAWADAHYSDPTLSLQTLASQMSYSPKYLSDCFSRTFNVGFREYVLTLRIQRACELMQNGVTSSKEIAYMIGFSDPLYYSKAFKRVLGTSPQKHIAELRRLREAKEAEKHDEEPVGYEPDDYPDGLL